MGSSIKRIAAVAVVALILLVAFARPASAQTPTPLATGWVYDPSTGSVARYVADEPVYWSESAGNWYTYQGYVYYGAVHYGSSSSSSGSSSSGWNGWDGADWLSRSAEHLAHLGRMWGWW